MDAPRSRSWLRSLPPIALITLALAAAWSVLLCAAPPPACFWSWQLQGSGIALAALGALLLGARMDLHGARMMPIWVAICFTQSLWAALAGVAVEAALLPFGRSAGSAGVLLTVGTGAVLLVIIAAANQSAWSLIPCIGGCTLSSLFATLAAGSLLHSNWYGACAASMILGALASLAWGVARVRSRAASIDSGHCPSCGYDARDVDHGPCPECGKHRDEVRDDLL